MPHEAATEPEWNSVTTPFDVDLHDVVQTNGGPYAVGGSGTLVANAGDGWEAVVTEGPGKQNRALAAIDVTADGDRVWYAGASGAIGMYDVGAVFFGLRDQRIDCQPDRSKPSAFYDGPR